MADYLNAQTAAGAQALMIFDTWGGMLTAAAFHEFSLRYMRQVLAALRREHDGQRIPVIVFTKGSAGWLEAMAESDCDAVGLDWNIDIGEARRRIGQRVALQGNLDPAVLFATPERIRTGGGRDSRDKARAMSSTWDTGSSRRSIRTTSGS